ncbi:MAG: sigma-54 dependent transcriptional regulator [Acidobacteriota bacterium]
MPEAGRPQVLVVDDELSICRSCEKVLARLGFTVKTALSGKQALGSLREQPFDLVITDLKMVEIGGMELIEILRNQYPDVIVVVITGYATIASVVETMKLGAFDYLPKPFTAQELASVAQKAWEKRKLVMEQRAVEAGVAIPEFPGIVGRSQRMQEVYSLIRKVAPTSSTVLIVGESGTGKELVARAIHGLSPRRDNRFFAVDCGTLSLELLQSELFGHVRGAFTGAIANKQGIFEAADSGTVFLDEICNVDLDIQGKLLRFVQERQFIPLGGTEVKQVDVRLIFATNRDLSKMVSEKSFREDLYYRLYVYPIHLPPLRERKEDVPLLAFHILKKMQERTGREAATLSEAALRLLEKYDWPGNIRQLENAIEWAVINHEGGPIEPHHLPKTIHGIPPDITIPATKSELLALKRRLRDEAVGEVERAFVVNALERSGWNVSRAAEDVGMQRQNLQALMRKYGIRQLQKDGPACSDP